MARRKANKLHGIDCNYFAGLYAEKLMQNARLRVEALPQLHACDLYTKLDQYKQNEVTRNIQETARKMLCDAGYAVAFVDGIFRNNQ